MGAFIAFILSVGERFVHFTITGDARVERKRTYMRRTLV